MPRLTRRDKALAYIAEGRVHVERASERGIVVQVWGSKREPYTAALGIDKHDRPFASCTCEGADYHPTNPRCSHVEVCRLLRKE